MRSSSLRNARVQDDKLKAHPLESPLIGGIYLMIFLR